MHMHQKFYFPFRTLQYGDRVGYGKKLKEEADDQERARGKKKKAERKSTEIAWAAPVRLERATAQRIKKP